MRVQMLTDDLALRETFGRLCSSYRRLEAAVAWCGSPREEVPYSLMVPVAKRTSVLVGADFDHTHPEGLDRLRELGVAVRIVKAEEGIFHPKVYLFERPGRAALLVGSANMTKNAFFTNEEAATLVEGTTAEMRSLVQRVRGAMRGWRQRSFELNDRWLDDYRNRYQKAKKYFKGRRARLSPAAFDEEPLAPLTFIMKTGWPEYYRRVQRLLDRPEAGVTCGELRKRVLDRARGLIPGDLTLDMLERREIRALLIGRGGRNDCSNALFGSVGAKGSGLPWLLASGPDRRKRVVVDAFNVVRRMGRRVDYDRLLAICRRLCSVKGKTGFNITMLVWGRLLLLARPDLYLSVSYSGLRRHLSRELEIPQSRFVEPRSYVRALRLLHSTPWFQSARPALAKEQVVWDARVAYIDVLYYGVA